VDFHVLFVSARALRTVAALRHGGFRQLGVTMIALVPLILLLLAKGGLTGKTFFTFESLNTIDNHRGHV
jgi:hypothetical protein